MNTEPRIPRHNEKLTNTSYTNNIQMHFIICKYNAIILIYHANVKPINSSL